MRHRNNCNAQLVLSTVTRSDFTSLVSVVNRKWVYKDVETISDVISL